MTPGDTVRTRERLGKSSDDASGLAADLVCDLVVQIRSLDGTESQSSIDFMRDCLPRMEASLNTALKAVREMRNLLRC